jgi:nitroreductase
LFTDGRWPRASSNSVNIPRTVEFQEVVRGRRMTRAFARTAVPHQILEHCIDLALRAPSAGKAQGWHVLMFANEETMQYWDIALPEPDRQGFAFPSLLNAPVIMLSLADTEAYLSRYSEPDKTHTGLGASLDIWPAPYWTIDASFSTMTLLHALHDQSVSSLFFAHAREPELRSAFGIPDSVQILGVIAAGYPKDAPQREGRSAHRPRRSPQEIIHHLRW